MEYRILLNTTWEKLNKCYEQESNELNIKFYYGKVDENLYEVLVRTNEKSKFKEGATYTLEEAKNIERKAKSKGFDR